MKNIKVLSILQTEKSRILLSVTSKESILTSHTFYVMISSEPRRTTALFVVIKHSTFSIHSTCRVLVTWIVTLSLQTLICQATLFIWLTRCWNVTHIARKVKYYHQIKWGLIIWSKVTTLIHTSTYVSIAVGVWRTVIVHCTRYRFRSATYMNVIWISFITWPTDTTASVIISYTFCIRTTNGVLAHICKMKYNS